LWALSRGLAYATDGQPSRALVEYERAIQVDASNPYAYVAISRHYLELGDGPRALRNLEQAELLLGLADPGEGRHQQNTDAQTERIQPHLDGLRGGALLVLGREAEARPLLDRAREGAPGVWGDGRLSAEEFR
jgi:tetratricopeptide (TPR) repeat protein